MSRTLALVFPFLLSSSTLLTGCGEGAPSEDTGPDDTGGDLDGDGYGVADGDCDDTDSAVHPGAGEVCDGIDNDCDGWVDGNASDAPTWYADLDGDGYGDSSNASEACEAPGGHVADATDCDDADPSVHPGADETCDGVDQDCDGTVDEDATDALTFWTDADGDGFGDPKAPVQACTEPEGTSTTATDCDDADPAIHPGATEICNDLDDDCDTRVDEGATRTVYRDADGDEWGTLEVTAEACSAEPGWSVFPGDCDDADATIHPYADENCDGVDQDCDDEVDEDPVDGLTWYADLDGDGYGDPEATTEACDRPEGYLADPSDCDDGDPEIHPDASEWCDGVDNDCDGEVDDDVVTGEWYADADGDGYGDPDAPVTDCRAPDGYVADATDCDDTDASTWPGAPEACDGLDHDCDGEVDDDASGTSERCPAADCAEVLEADPDAADGTYWLDPDGGGAFEAACEMDVDGGGWTQMTDDWLAAAPSDATWRYLYTYGDAWYESPTTSYVWSWETYQAAEGTYAYASSGTTATGSFDCRDGEDGYWGVGCSNGGGTNYKCLPYGSTHDEAQGEATICQDRPDVFMCRTCQAGVQIWMREE